MILQAVAGKLKRISRGDFKGRQFEGGLIVQAVSWYLRYPLSSATGTSRAYSTSAASRSTTARSTAGFSPTNR